MTPETLLAHELGSLPTKKEKLAARMEQLSAEDLEQVLRGKTKVAFGPPAAGMGMARPAGMGMARPAARAGAAMGKMPAPVPVPPVAPPMPSLMKGASVRVADDVGRYLAHMEKTALPAGGSMLLGKAMKGVMGVPRAAGALGGAALGAGRYMMSDDPNKSLVANVAGGAALGGAAQAAMRTALPAMMRSRGPGLMGDVGTYMRQSNRLAAPGQAKAMRAARAGAKKPAGTPAAAKPAGGQLTPAPVDTRLPHDAPANWKGARQPAPAPAAPNAAAPSMGASGVRESGPMAAATGPVTMAPARNAGSRLQPNTAARVRPNASAPAPVLQTTPVPRAAPAAPAPVATARPAAPPPPVTRPPPAAPSPAQRAMHAQETAQRAAQRSMEPAVIPSPIQLTKQVQMTPPPLPAARKAQVMRSALNPDEAQRLMAAAG